MGKRSPEEGGHIEVEARPTSLGENNQIAEGAMEDEGELVARGDAIADVNEIARAKEKPSEIDGGNKNKNDNGVAMFATLVAETFGRNEKIKQKKREIDDFAKTK